jgi:hypothetical protein
MTTMFTTEERALVADLALRAAGKTHLANQYAVNGQVTLADLTRRQARVCWDEIEYLIITTPVTGGPVPPTLARDGHDPADDLDWYTVDNDGWVDWRGCAVALGLCIAFWALLWIGAT